MEGQFSQLRDNDVLLLAHLYCAAQHIMHKN